MVAACPAASLPKWHWTRPPPRKIRAKSSCPACRICDLSRFWELESASDCGTFGIRGYRPISLSWIGSDSVNTAPSSPAAGHTAAYRAYREHRDAHPAVGAHQDRPGPADRRRRSSGLDSLWFGYTSSPTGSCSTADLSRPFRSTDHEPELTYIYPTDAPLPGGWRLRYSGISAVHQSNGQSLPLSRSWNRVVLMTGLEKDSRSRCRHGPGPAAGAPTATTTTRTSAT
jgi:phospholipase A1